jgi:hypothetical protein
MQEGNCDFHLCMEISLGCCNSVGRDVVGQVVVGRVVLGRVVREPGRGQFRQLTDQHTRLCSSHFPCFTTRLCCGEVHLGCTYGTHRAKKTWSLIFFPGHCRAVAPQQPAPLRLYATGSGLPCSIIYFKTV